MSCAATLFSTFSELRQLCYKEVFFVYKRLIFKYFKRKSALKCLYMCESILCFSREKFVNKIKLLVFFGKIYKKKITFHRESVIILELEPSFSPNIFFSPSFEYFCFWIFFSESIALQNKKMSTYFWAFNKKKVCDL